MQSRSARIVKRLSLIVLFVLAILLVYAGWIKYRSLSVRDGGPPLAIRWEGFYHDMNFRDLGASLNGCLEKKVFREGILMRSAGWFSGWSCDKVGNPEVIYSLNYSPRREERYFCMSEDRRIIGRYFNPDVQLNNLEFAGTWNDGPTRTATCRFLKDLFISILENQTVLMHCDAGRDRTGAFSALIAAMAAENSGILNQEMLDAIECDYRKTESLTPSKQGRMEAFIQSIRKDASVSEFLSQQCNIDPSVLSIVSNSLMN